MKASAFRRWPVAGAYSPEQTTRLTGGSDFLKIIKNEYTEEKVWIYIRKPNKKSTQLCKKDIKVFLYKIKVHKKI